jgi:SOS-response transcriptional repressor LexA
LILRAIAEGSMKGMSPTYRELASLLGSGNASAARDHVIALMKKGLVEHLCSSPNRMARRLRPTNAGWAAYRGLE